MVFVYEDVHQDGGDGRIVRRHVLDVLPADEVHAAVLEFNGDRAGRAGGDVLGVDPGTPIVDQAELANLGGGDVDVVFRMYGFAVTRSDGPRGNHALSIRS